MPLIQENFYQCCPKASFHRHVTSDRQRCSNCFGKSKKKKKKKNGTKKIKKTLMRVRDFISLKQIPNVDPPNMGSFIVDD